MKTLRVIVTRIKGLIFGHAIRKEIDEEWQIHLEMDAERNIARGMSPEEAKLAARKRFGNGSVIKERALKIKGCGLFESLWQDARYGLRILMKSPVFTAVAVLSVALGIGANTAIFSVVDGLMLKRLPVSNPERLFTFALEGNRSEGWGVWPYGWYQRLRDRSPAFSDIAASGMIERSNVTINGSGSVYVGRLRIGLVSGNYFSTLGVNAAVGRTLMPDDDSVPGGRPVTVISYAFWKTNFGGATNVVGRTITINGTTYSILGVAAPTFFGEEIGHSTDIWVPTAMETQIIPEHPDQITEDWRTGWAWVRIIGRLKTDVTTQRAATAATAVLQQIEAERAEQFGYKKPQPNDPMRRIQLVPAASGSAPERRTFARPLTILMIVVGLVLLIACANVANLLLARSAMRTKEMAVRLALGAGRSRIVRQLLTESLLLALMGGALGLLFAQLGANVLSKIVASGLDPVNLDLRPNGRILLFTSVLCLFSGLLFGSAPALRTTKVDLASGLKGGETGSIQRPSGGLGEWFGLRKLLVIVQVALSLALLIGAGLFLRTLGNLRSQDVGFDREHTLLVWTGPIEDRVSSLAAANLRQAMVERISSLPGVISASASMYGVLNGADYRNDSVEFKVEGQTPTPGLQWIGVLAAQRYFETLGLPLIQGRDFTPADYTASAPQVAIINETMARFFFGNENPIGKRFASNARDVGYPREIIGIVKDSKYATPRDKNLGILYRPDQPSQARTFTPLCIVVRTKFNSPGMATRIQQELRGLDASIPVLSINTVEEQLNQLLMQERLITTLSTVLGGLGVLLACLGLYGVISYTVARRTKEIGIRLALGATRTYVLCMVLKESLWLVLAGIATGVLIACASARLISSLLFGISPVDPTTIAAAALLMTIVAAFAGFLPANRASRVDPMIALRSE